MPDRSPPLATKVVAANATAPAGLLIEASDTQGAWHTLGSATGLRPFLAVPRGADAKLVLRAWLWGGLHARLRRAGGSATPTSCAARASQGPIRALTLVLDHSVVADQLNAK